MKKRLTTSIVLQEKVEDLEVKLGVEMRKVRDGRIVESERNMLLEEKKEWNDRFMGLLTRCRSMNGELPLDGSEKMEGLTVPAVVSFLFFHFCCFEYACMLMVSDSLSLFGPITSAPSAGPAHEE